MSSLNMEINMLIGVAGLLLITIAFALNLFHKLSSRNASYSLINFVGAVCLAYYAWFLGSVPFFILQIIWAVFSLIKLAHLKLI